MNDTTAEPRDKARDTVAMTAATMGHDIVAAMLNELRNMPDHWSRLNAELQQKTIERLKDKTQELVTKALHFMLTSDFQAVPAKLEKIGRGKGIFGAITVQNNAAFRHALFDATGQHVLVVIADPAQWLARMEEIKARDNQLELFSPDANYDPERDQPGYRRDMDPFAPSPSWEDMKRQLGIGETKSPDPETPAPKDQTDSSSGAQNAAPEGDSLTPKQEQAATLEELRDRLRAIGVHVSLGLLQSRSPADILAACRWMEWCENDEPDGNPGRPDWLPASAGNE